MADLFLRDRFAAKLGEVLDFHNFVLQHYYRAPAVDFQKTLDFVNRVGAVAEEQGHHPDILLTWGKAEVTLWTHKVNGLTESDFIMAAKIDRIPR